MYTQQEMKQWKDTAASALKQSGDLLSVAGDKASTLAHRALEQAHRLYPRLVKSASTVGDQARSNLLAWGATARDGLSSTRDGLSHLRDGLYDTSLQVGYSARKAVSLGMWLGGLYVAARVLCSKDSKIRETKEAVEQHIRSKPVDSALIALGIGYVISRLR